MRQEILKRLNNYKMLVNLRGFICEVSIQYANPYTYEEQISFRIYKPDPRTVYIPTSREDWPELIESHIERCGIPLETETERIQRLMSQYEEG